jgi:hypothetical protein
MKGLLLAALVAFLATTLLPATAAAGPEPGTRKKGFRLFARALGAMTINRVYCGLSADGQVCVDSTNSSTIGGGFWPKGTPDQYVFNSGMQVAGVIGTDGGPWANDTTGGFFFDATGQLPNNEAVQPIYNASNADDIAIGAWPGAACVPQATNDPAAASLFNPLLQTDVTTGPDGAGSGVPNCRRSASQGDVWFMAWEGNPALTPGRKHPLGIAVETRGMGWNFPSGNEDILYYIYTFYNITSTRDTAYSGIRDPIKTILLGLADRFHTENAARGANLPLDGYTITNMFAGFGADMDVSEASSNYSSVNLPFALGYVYEEAFAGSQGWLFDPSIFATPFFPGAGFVGVKYLKSPTGPGAIQLFSNTANTPLPPGAIGDPRDVKQLYRYLSGVLDQNAGDALCSVPGSPAVTHVCYVNVASPADMRFFQSSTPLTLPPGKAGSIVVAYIFAAPVVSGLCPGISCTNVKPATTAADVLRLTDAATLLSSGANPVDTITGYRGFTDRPDPITGQPDGIVSQSEIAVVPGSLLGKSLVAQQVFDNQFLLPFAPDPPPFYLIPGDNQVSVIWQPSPSDNLANPGDPFFLIANAATLANGDPNPLYDPNYRQHDVEGYRIYRGRVDAPNELTLLAQFDYGGTVISDYTGVINPVSTCMPEANVLAGCPVAFAAGGNQKNGTTLTVHTDYDIVDGDPTLGDLVQLSVTGASKGRALLATGEAVILKADTAVSGGGKNGGCGPKSACPPLDNTGIPFTFVDKTPKNSFRYFYSVTAFDVNSFESGPSSLESARNTKPVTPTAPAGNFANVSNTQLHLVGRGVAMDTIYRFVPLLDPLDGRFGGPFPPSNAGQISFFGDFIGKLFKAPGHVSAKLLALGLGDSRYGTATNYRWFVTTADGDTTTISFDLFQQFSAATATANTPPFPAATADSASSAAVGVPKGTLLTAFLVQRLTNYQVSNGWGRGCVDGSISRGGKPAGSCSYNGPRWFSGPNETKQNPNSDNNENGTAASFNNAGELPGVSRIFSMGALNSVDAGHRAVASALGSAIRAADMRVYWGTAGKVDSVIDITHNVPVPFIPDSMTASFGILNQVDAQAAGSADGRTELSWGDFGCVEPLRSAVNVGGGAELWPCTSAAPYLLTDQVVLGNAAFYTGSFANVATAAATPNSFAMYLSGHLFMFQMASATLPAKGDVWTCRSYLGTVQGGSGVAGNFGAYTFRQPEVRNFAAIGAELSLDFQADNTVHAVTAADLRRVHTVPDPYYVTNAFEQATDNKVIKFVNLPRQAIIRIYSSSGVLVNILEHNATDFGGEETWNVRNRNNQVVASGVYFYHIESNDGATARRVGRMTIVNFAQ